MTVASALRLSFLVFLVTFLTGCGTAPEPSPGNSWQKAELTDIQVNTVQSVDGILFAGTDRGVYKKSFSSNWTKSGLDIDSAQVVDFVLWNKKELLAAVKNDDFRSQRPVLFKSQDGGNSWNDIEVQYDKELAFFTVGALEVDLNNPNILYANTGYISKSSDRGSTWHNLHMGYTSEFLTVSKFHQNIIWTGGWTNIFSPYLAKSEDGGETWSLLNEQVYNEGDATCSDILIHPTDTNSILVGMFGATNSANIIRKSTNGGQTWQTVFEGTNITTLNHSARNPKTVYASGQNRSGTAFFVRSDDFGDSWEMFEYEESEAGIQVRDITSAMVKGKEVVYLGTNKGIYSYTFGN